MKRMLMLALLWSCNNMFAMDYSSPVCAPWILDGENIVLKRDSIKRIEQDENNPEKYRAYFDSANFIETEKQGNQYSATTHDRWGACCLKPRAARVYYALIKNWYEQESGQQAEEVVVQEENKQ